MRPFRFFALTVLLALGQMPVPVQAWGNHTLASYRALENLPEVSAAAPVAVESLDRFLKSEETTLEALLASQEAWAASNLSHYPTRPAALAFKADPNRSETARRVAFLSALRVAPNVKFALFAQPDPRLPAPVAARLAYADVSTLPVSGHVTQSFVSLQPGEMVSPLTVLATATDEPDYGLDINLWDDSPSTWGRTYGFGKQPFGNPALAISSQAPFHMGFKHESKVLYLAAPFIKRTYPIWRYYQWSSLSGLAFRSGHAYWGWRFAGLALHYLQDLTQPYHAKLAPGESDARLLMVNALATLGATGLKDKTVVLLSNRHLALERYQTALLLDAAHANRNGELEDALHNSAKDADYPAWNDQSLRNVVAAEAARAADGLVPVLLAAFPESYVADPAFDFGAQADQVDLLAEMRQRDPKTVKPLDTAIARLLGHFGTHSRNALRAILKSAPQANVREN